MIHFDNIAKALRNFKHNQPFDYCVVDNFFDPKTAISLEADFPKYDEKVWFEYNNPLEHKKALNDWNKYPPLTYQILMIMNSPQMIQMLEKYVGVNLFPDMGLHGGGWHIHGQGGDLNPHFDYSIHPKCGLQRKLNIIIYLSQDLRPSQHKGHLGFWSHDEVINLPKELVSEVAPVFNRAVIFDTTQNSWHGMSQKLKVPKGIYRKSLAVYYLTEPKQAQPHQRAVYAPRDNQKNNKKILKAIKLRQDSQRYAKAYKLK